MLDWYSIFGLCGSKVFELVHSFQRFSIHPYGVGRWSWLNTVDENFAFVGADFYAVTQQQFSLVFQWVGSTSSLPPSRSMSMDTDDSGMSMSSASSAKQPFSDGCWGVKASCAIFSMNLLNGTGHPCRTPTVVWNKAMTLQPQRWSLHRTTSWWLQSVGCQFCIHLRLVRNHHARHRTLSWNRWNCDRIPFDVTRTFPPTVEYLFSITFSVI